MTIRTCAKRALPLVLLSLLTACGTTVPLTTQGADGAGAAQDGLTALPPQQPGSGAAATGGSGGSGSTGSASPTQPLSSAPSAGIGTASPPTTSRSTPTLRGSGRGYTEKEVYIGVGDLSGTEAISSLGVQGIGSLGDPRGETQALVDDVNRRGGLAGRKVVVVWFTYDTSQVLFDPNTAAQSSCAYWTQDRPVFAVLNPAVTNDVFLSCLAKAKVPVIHASGVLNENSYQGVLDRYPLYFNISTMIGEVFNRIAMNRLAARGFFQPWNTTQGGPGKQPVKIGMLAKEGARGDAILASHQRELAKHGHKLDSVVRYSADVAASQPQQSNAVLRFRTDGITHVFGASATFMTQAEQQNFRPRYFIPTAHTVYAATAPDGQLNGAMSVGFVPAQDVAADGYPGHPTPATTYCLNVLRKAGYKPADQTNLWTMQTECDAVYSLKAATDITGQLTATALTAGIEALGTTWQSSMTWQMTLGPSRHAGVAAVRDLDFRSSTRSFFYASTRNWTG